MDNLLGKSSRKAKPKKKQPMKVVYISNPMKFKISASEFRALVQELTGQYSELPADPSKRIVDSSDDHVGGGNHTVLDHASSKTDDDYDVDNHALDQVPTVLDLSGKQQQLPAERQDDDDYDASLFESSPFDDYFMPQMLENFYQQG
ncbi:uncharacterized protein LOC8273898 [Ricinus communis]|uniref:VQ domain-containing protein n=1 Tax=Ricinus communis TaxID=3988 RepID=B9S866_RICCO|nr:uncharacterized protein LOC8273898 [Ricinus communis]EEF40226.1 conserved hypothetical protein [Ricinus communis]|eukprot:XP_002522185.1 uncharacterized protein LOC8273898 [Ricinus communis]